jgi:hypothetical protein
MAGVEGFEPTTLGFGDFSTLQKPAETLAFFVLILNRIGPNRHLLAFTFAFRA